MKSSRPLGSLSPYHRYRLALLVAIGLYAILAICAASVLP
ncbi:hypothetical protein SAMN05216270_107264 [Glycomyces harbinensis]|uniref:Uncharacterized protein n=1 Tax=Glycomyces harbinensis TaxID=58114 RepID=A0A1G6XQN3_9ACTN|nr:hypothetical protein SAMN05216270_107264 [Glycomyces harbinensis]